MVFLIEVREGAGGFADPIMGTGREIELGHGLSNVCSGS
jgi:hypothetical protein